MRTTLNIAGLGLAAALALTACNSTPATHGTAASASARAASAAASLKTNKHIVQDENKALARAKACVSKVSVTYLATHPVKGPDAWLLCMNPKGNSTAVKVCFRNAVNANGIRKGALAADEIAAADCSVIPNLKAKVSFGNNPVNNPPLTHPAPVAG